LALAWSHWGHLLIVIQEGRRLASTEQKLLGFEKRGHVAFARVPGEREANASCRQGNAASQISWCLLHALQAAATRPSSVKNLYYGKNCFKDLKPMHIFSLVICRGVKLVIA